MHLILDIGNTTVKYHLFQKGRLVKAAVVDTVEELSPFLFEEFSNITHLVYADVRGLYTLQQLQALFPTLTVANVKSLTLPFDSLYMTPTTLGDDRLALVAAAVKKYPKQDCLIIDAGSCLTFDFISAAGKYLGGAISPGLQMRYKSLHHFTGKLPLVNGETPPALYGDSTERSICAGVMHGILHEIEGQMNAYQKKYPSLTVILTGGDGLSLSKSVKNTIFAEPNFLAEGLNFLLEYNKS